MASSFPPNCSKAARSCSCCFWARSSLVRFSMLRFSCQREKRIQPTTSVARTSAAQEYTKGFLKADFFCGSGRASMHTLHWRFPRKCTRNGLGSGAAEEEVVDAVAHIPQVGFAAAFELRDGTARVADIDESLSHRGPVHIAIAEVDPGIAIFLALEVFEVNVGDALAERSNPILRIAVKDHVADVEPSLDPRAFEIADVLEHFEGTKQELVPHFFDGDHNF